ncbi:mediator of DNA damage checkpoint protein 1 [Tachysurus fulvidraco]|uniref:mediator of DNA damage checkpoint protein 1 n=1 Tax=Tachysurus fulvidraco TaxID=1234273 RepID=UPI001FEE6D23|nr:mediator of DNA damage checkpoint protein 1 [Tachysurus fulvidraco]
MQVCMDSTQQIEDSFFGEQDDSGDEHELAEGESQREPLAVLKVFKNNHIPETEVPLYQGENVLGRDPSACSVPLQARSVSSRHAVISISVFGPNNRHGHSEDVETLLWDLGSLNGTRKGRLKLSPQVRYALTEGDSVVLADLPCQYVSLKNTERNTHTSAGDKATRSSSSSGSTEGGAVNRVDKGRKKTLLPPVPVWSDEAKRSEPTLVPESDSDSDGEKHGRRERRRIVASDSASSDFSSPTCSAFLTPANKIIPESEDESSITPSSALTGRCPKTGNDTEFSSDSSKPGPLHFSIDSDTDVEDDDMEMTKAKPAIEAAVMAEVPAVNPADLHMDSDTDVEEEDMEKVKTDSEALVRPPAKQDLVDPAVLTMDSDTDVEDDDMEMTKAKPAIEAAVTAEVPAVNPADLHVDSDTDVEEEDMKVKSDSEALGKAPAKQDLVDPAALTMDSDTDVAENKTRHDVASISGPAAALEEKKEALSSAQLNLESDTDDEDVPHIQDSRPPNCHVAEFNMNSDTDVDEDEETTKVTDGKHLVKQDNDFPDARILRHESDSDTDVEDDGAKIGTPTVAKETGTSQTAGERNTDTQHGSSVRLQSPAETLPDELRLNSDTDMEEDEDETEEKAQKCAEGSLQTVQSSTPRGAGLSEEEKETQAFLSPSQLFKRPGLPSLLHPFVSPGGVSHTDDDFAVAETQSFVCDAAQADGTLDETPQSLDVPEPQRSDGASSFQLDLSGSSHQPQEAEELDREPEEEDWQLQSTQLYAMKNSEGSTKAGQTQLDLDATQAYIESSSQEEEGDEGKDEGEDETPLLAALCHSSIHTAETPLIKHGAQKEDLESNEEVGASEPERKEEEIQADSHLSTADTLLIIRSPRQEEQTQPYTVLTEKFQNEREETESKDQEVQDRDEGQNEMEKSVGQENDDGSEIKRNERTVTENGDVRNQVEDVKKERDENKRGENEVGEARTQPAEDDTIVETLPMCEEEDEEGHEEHEDVPSFSRGTWSAQVESTQRIEPDHQTRAAITIAETLPMCEEEEGQEEEENELKNSRRPGRRRKKQEAPEQSAESDKVASATVSETLPMCEEEEGQEEEENELKNSRRPGRRRKKQEAPKLPVESDLDASTTISETLPMCEVEEGREEEENKLKNSRRPGRRRPTEEAPKQSVESDKVTSATISETLPMCEEDDKGEEEEQPSKVLSTKRSGMRRQNPKANHRRPVEVPETLPMCEEEEGQEEKPQSEVKSVRKSHRGRQTSKSEATQSVEADSTAEATKPQREEEEEQNSRRSLRVQERGRAASVKGKGRGRAAAGKDRAGKRGKVEKDEESEEDIDNGSKGGGGKKLKQNSKDDDKTRLGLAQAENEEKERLKKQEDKEEIKRLQKEREEREEREKKEQEKKDRLERERIDREKKEREQKEQFEREMKEKEEKERLERKQQLEKERREQEEKDRLEQEREERENKEKEENEKLEKERRERQELEEKIELERKEQEEKDALAREKREREEKEMKEEEENQGRKMKQKEKRGKDNTEGEEKDKRPAPGRRKAEIKGKKSRKDEDQELAEGIKERLESEQEPGERQKQECEESSSKTQEDEQAGSDSKPRRGRRTARKSLAPPAGMEDEGGPAKRTRSRSNSSNSVCSEQSTQDSLCEGRRRGRRRTSTVPSSEKKDTQQAVHSNFRSSDRSSISVAPQGRGRAAKRKSGKPDEQEEHMEEEEERKQSAAVGRGRGGKRSGADDIKVEAEKEEESLPAEDRVKSQTSSRGRKRGADVSTAEAPLPTPKTPRRSLTGPTHKVLFTGVVDEDGEKALVRLGGGLAKGVADMTHLVTDKVRRTVKFLCAVARGVSIVTPDWLIKSAKAGSFLSPNGFLVKDAEQEKKFNFSLQDALGVASSQPLLQGYEIHVTPSVKPEPAQMKEIITCCGARFLPKMPSAHKAQTVVVVSCEEDRALCERARSLSFPVVSAEFLLTGILQQKVDLQTHRLSATPAAAAPKTNARTRGK